MVACKTAGFGGTSLQYLSKYLYRGVVSEKVISCKDGNVSFRYQESKTKKMRSRTFPGEGLSWGGLSLAGLAACFAQGVTPRKGFWFSRL